MRWGFQRREADEVVAKLPAISPRKTKLDDDHDEPLATATSSVVIESVDGGSDAGGSEVESEAEARAVSDVSDSPVKIQ